MNARWAVGIAAVLIVAALTWSSPAAAPDPGTLAGPQVAEPWRPGRPELGVQVYWEDNPADSPQTLRTKARRVLDHVVGLEANAVVVSFPFFSPSITSSRVETDGRTPSPERIGVVLDEIERAGLRATLRPLLDEKQFIEHDSRSWRGQLTPADRDVWYASYQEFLEPYLVMAQAHGVATVVVGAELNALHGDPHWAEVVRRARELYSGELAYSANWDAYGTALSGVPVDVVGVDAYPKLGLKPTTSQAEVTEAFGRWLDRTAVAGTSKLIVHELGGAAETRMFDDPAVPHTRGTALDEDIQRRWFTAACDAARERRIAGFYWWRIDFHADPGQADPLLDRHDSFLGRPAERAVRDCFTAWKDVR